MRDAAPVVVLLVDDQMIVAAAVKKMLAEEKDLAFHYCATSEKALATAQSVKPTVILQDLVMPGLDGFAVLKLLREDPDTAAIPIIVLSSKEDPRDKSRAFAEGASDYLVKLPDKIELVARVRAHSERFLAEQQLTQAYRALAEMKEQLEHKNAQLQRLSALDGLTGIANRRRFDEGLEQEWKRARRDQEPISLIMLDIDHFKKFNDCYGHQRGDEVLKQIARALAGAVKRPTDFVARYGGEEFGAVLGSTDAAGAKTVAGELKAAVTALAIPHERSDTAGHVTISMGVATLRPTTETGFESLVAMADEALYKTKHAGRDGFTVHEKSVR
jgi:two-component system, chemotaxis family, response regulator WspR